MDATTTPVGPTPTILQAIVTRRCVTATYNREPVVLAPHVLFTKHDQLHVGAVTLERSGQPPRELKLGVFKLDGLGEIALTGQPFAASQLWNATDDRFAGNTLMAID